MKVMKQFRLPTAKSRLISSVSLLFIIAAYVAYGGFTPPMPLTLSGMLVVVALIALCTASRIRKVDGSLFTVPDAAAARIEKIARIEVGFSLAAMTSMILVFISVRMDMSIYLIRGAIILSICVILAGMASNIFTVRRFNSIISKM